MAAKQLKGVGGVLGNLLTPEEAAPPSPPQESQSEPQVTKSTQETAPVPVQGPTPVPTQAPPKAAAQDLPQPAPKPAKGTKTEARRGRPLAGSRTSEPVEREKVSLRLRSDLAAAYRDWSWEERCQFSDLVDRALESYLKNRQKARKPERE